MKKLMLLLTALFLTIATPAMADDCCKPGAECCENGGSACCD